ncbi:MAG: hypothetical protein A3G18_12140 [Rhodospirillales bacterium RIFCSPLOWO2_12_FULL_58_28]|nr:MAG: hypothetical protein A3H92_12155 [Rhodospirillales bacterium RIFCSPLOWO2_02_FULL_58_16]OHC79615.1 MAG: hypothetical protein A3G18_12140 [Rhodospirillales bacterium RIFCSPLOWO2_12_FULL_58_28]
MPTKALVTIVIGDSYTRLWEQVMAETWREYARRHGYEIIVIDKLIDGSDRGRGRHINWQKCLILEHEEVRNFDDVVWIDADVKINFHTAPCIVGHNNSDLIGVVSNKESYYDVPATGDNLMVRHRSLDSSVQQCRSIQDLYAKAGLDAGVDDAANTGVIVLKPKRHAAILRHVYDNFEENRYTMKEELPLSSYFFKNKLVNTLDKRFNWPWVYHLIEHYPFLLIKDIRNDLCLVSECVNAAWSNSWFLHFTGDTLDGEQSLREHARLVIQKYTGLNAYASLWSIFAGNQSG